MGILRYPHLFEPIRIGGTIFRNRLFSSPTGPLDVDLDGSPTESVIAYYGRKAMGGAASVAIGECNVDRKRGTRGLRHTDMQSSTNTFMLCRLAAAISSQGAVASTELQHSGYAANSLPGTSGPAFGPVEMDFKGKHVAAMDEAMILETVGLFADAAAYAKSCGFGMVTLHGAHGWLIQQFFSPAFNTRTDRWGGNDENRARFAVAICDAIHAKCGRDFPVEIRIGGSEIEPGGYGVDGGIAFARQLDGHADIIHVSVGASRPGVSTFSRTHPSMFHADGCNVEFAAAIKPHVRQSRVATVGALIEPEQMEEIIASGQADIVEAARALICDPDLPNKARAGRDGDIRRCMRCYACFNNLMSKGDFLCALNPASSHERELSLPPAEPKNVLVVGGGIAGLQAALTAAENGHRVVLCEKTDRLGGAILCEEKVPFKKNLDRYIRRQVAAVTEAGVDIRLNTPVTRELALALKPDVLIAALGSQAAVPAVCAGSVAIGAEAAYADPDQVGRKAVILGGGLVGTELAVYLASLGREVVILELSGQYQDGGNGMHFGTVVEELKRLGVKTRFHAQAEAIDERGVTCADGHFEPADTVINAAGRVPRQDEALALYDCAPAFHLLGDCRSPRSIQAATSEAWRIARSIGRC